MDACPTRLLLLLASVLAGILTAQDSIRPPRSFGINAALHCSFDDARNALPTNVGEQNFRWLPLTDLDDSPSLAGQVEHSEVRSADSSLQPLLDYLAENVKSNPKRKNYNGPEISLSSGYRLRLDQRGYWQLFSAKLRPVGNKILRLPLDQPFKKFFLSSASKGLELRGDRGELIPTGDKVLLSVITGKFIVYRGKNGLLGVLNDRGEPFLPARFTSVGPTKYQQLDTPTFTATTRDREDFTYFPALDLLLKDAGTPLRLFDNRYLVTSDNVFDLRERTQLFCDPCVGHVWALRSFGIGPPSDTLLICEPRNEDNTILLFTLQGNILGEVQSRFLGFHGAEADGYYTASGYSRAETEEGKSHRVFDQNFDVIYRGTGTLRVIATDPPLINDEGPYSSFDQHFITLSGDTVLSTDRSDKWRRIGTDTLLIMKYRGGSGVSDHALVYDVRQRRITDTIMNIRLAYGNYFVEANRIRDHNFVPISTTEGLAPYYEYNHEAVRGLPIAYRTGCCGKEYATLTGEAYEDAAGNRNFHNISAIDERTILLPPGSQKLRSAYPGRANSGFPE